MTADALTEVVGRVVGLGARGDHDRETLGGKAWSIQNMLRLGIPVPPAFAITTEVCRDYHRVGGESGHRTVPDHVWDGVRSELNIIEEATSRGFGAAARPLLVSVRSGAATSMPGMMDTVLNLGMTDAVEDALAAESGDVGFAADTRARFAHQFTAIVGHPPPDDPWQQLRDAVYAVLDSWQSPRATAYRDSRGISDVGGTAVTVQAMVFGNLGADSGTGVLFSRNPLTGDRAPYGEWLPGGQGEDVVSGRSDALVLDELAAQLPSVHSQLLHIADVLEREEKDLQDIEFTVEEGRLWLLQCRSAKRTPHAAVHSAVAMVDDGLLTTDEALDRITGDQVRALTRPHLDEATTDRASVLATGKPAAPGIRTGVVVTDPDVAEERTDAGEDVILARPTTDPDDVAAMSVSVAVLTELGGSTSHAAVVCREMAVPCVVGCGAGSLAGLTGRIVTVDAGRGIVYDGALPVVDGVQEAPDLDTIMHWLDEIVAPATDPDLAARLDEYHQSRKPQS